MRKQDGAFYARIIEEMGRRKNLFGVVLCVASDDNRVSWCGAAGEMASGGRYFIASVTKLYVTALVMKLIEEQRLSIDDKIETFFPEGCLNGLHVLKGTDLTSQLTISHLISNTSGLPDYFFHRQENGKSAADNLLAGIDEPWGGERTIQTVKKLKPNFRPGRKAAYSDTNYQLLGSIIEKVTGKTITEVFKACIFDPLGLKDTYVYSDVSDTTPAPFYYKSKKLWLPEYMTSIGAEGGIVSSAEENMRFLKAFFNGHFFPKEKIEKLKKWNLILPPPGLFLYGIGLEKLWIPRIISPFRPIGEILGFWGQTGSFAWYNPKTGLYICGTTNQIDGSGHAAATKALLKIIKADLKTGRQ